jgi:hypothetical protein
MIKIHQELLILDLLLLKMEKGSLSIEIKQQKQTIIIQKQLIKQQDLSISQMILLK